MKHPTQEEIRAFLRGGAGDTEREIEIQDHLASCETCQEMMSLTVHENDSKEHRVNHILRERFLLALSRGQQPAIEAYLERASESGRAELLIELITAETRHRRREGETPRPAEYQQRFPEYCDQINDAFRVKSLGSFVNDETTSGREPDRLRKIGRHIIRRKLGEGAFGDVYLAHDPDLDRKVAIKVAKPDRFPTDQEMEALVEEARLAAMVKHEGLVAIYDIAKDADPPYIVLEFVNGGDLSHWLKSRRPDHFELAVLMKRIATAVGYAHQNGLVHRDLKPANILMDGEGNPHVADFGLALHADTQHEHRDELAGSPAYMSPEQVRGEAQMLDGRSDIWSLGVIFYQMLSRQLPFKSQSRDLLFEEIEDHPARPLRQIDPRIPKELERICLKCLNKRVDERYLCAADLVEDLEKWERGQSSAPASRSNAMDADIVHDAETLHANDKPEGKTPHDGNSSWRQWLIPTVGAIGLVGVIGIVAYPFLFPTPPPPAPIQLLVHDPQADTMDGPMPAALARQHHIFLQVDLPKPSYAYAILIDPNGYATPLHPWRYDWGEAPSNARSASQRLPEDKGWWLETFGPGEFTLLAWTCESAPSGPMTSRLDEKAFAEIPWKDRDLASFDHPIETIDGQPMDQDSEEAKIRALHQRALAILRSRFQADGLTAAYAVSFRRKGSSD